MIKITKKNMNIFILLAMTLSLTSFSGIEQVEPSSLNKFELAEIYMAKHLESAESLDCVAEDLDECDHGKYDEMYIDYSDPRSSEVD